MIARKVNTRTNIPDSVIGTHPTLQYQKMREQRITQRSGLHNSSQTVTTLPASQYDKLAAVSYDKALQTLMQSNLTRQFPNGAGENTPAAPSITDATKWSQETQNQFVQFQNWSSDQARRTTFQGAASNNMPDGFKIIGSTRATFLRKEEKQEEEGKSVEERIIEHRLQQERDEQVRRERKAHLSGASVIRELLDADIIAEAKLVPEWEASK